jgi:hypothetical protein
MQAKSAMAPQSHRGNVFAAQRRRRVQPFNASHLKKTEPTPRRGLLKQVFWFALLHFVILQALAGLIFMAAHIPPRAVNLDGVIDILVRIEDVLVFPRWLVLKLWPWEHTPRGLGLFLTIFNSAVWGAALAGLRNFWRKAAA